jgi:RNA recognition motif 2
MPPGGLTGPPGFKGGYLVDDPQSQGESLRSMGAFSAPPPPGFNPGPGERSRIAAGELLWSSDRDGAGSGPFPGVGGDSHEYNGMARHGGGEDGNESASGRTNSFSNLAAALGTGLAESMEDATSGELKAGPMLTDNFFLDSKNDLSYARQSRHLATRLLGSSPSKDAFGPSHTAPEAGSLFAPMSAGEKGFQNRRVGGGAPSQPSLLAGLPKPQQRGAPTSSGLTSAFSMDAGGGSRLGDLGSSYPPPRGPTDFNGNHENRLRLPATKDLGVTVMEPSDSFGRVAPSSSFGGLLSTTQQQKSPSGTYELERGMQNLWSGNNSADRSDNSVGNASTSSGRGELQLSPEEALQPFTWDVRHPETSRALVILRATTLPANEVSATCDIFGVVESFRSDFADRGMFFVSYFDIRAAQYAAMELQTQLQRLDDRADRILVQYGVPLNSSSQNDESTVVLTDVPLKMDLEGLASMLSSYGAVRSIKSLGGSYNGSSFLVEYNDTQDARQAVLELDSAQPWGPDVSVEAGPRNPADRKRGRELLALISRWRHGPSPHRRTPDRGGVDSMKYGGAPARVQGDRGMIHQANSRSPTHGTYSAGAYPPRHDARYDRGEASSRHDPGTQLVLGPDGRYSYVVVHNSPYPPSPYQDPPPERGVHGSRGIYVTHVHQPPSHNAQYWPPQHATHHVPSGGGSVVSGSSYPEGPHVARQYPSGSQSVPYFRHPADASSTGSHSHMMSMPPPSSGGGGDDKDNRHLMLDLDDVGNGRDTRTSLMVRNIPNKYTQQMLLSEFSENGHGPGIIDFFYLPIDFKNRCNRGYAFINFVDYRDILPFHRRYYGKHWRTFNSDKICDITYARIQGKSAMLKRFENSALMEKDDEYKPLVFVSHGPEKGTRLPFPDPSSLKP